MKHILKLLYIASIAMLFGALLTSCSTQNTHAYHHDDWFSKGKKNRVWSHRSTWEWKNGRARKMRRGERPDCIDAW